MGINDAGYGQYVRFHNMPPFEENEVCLTHLKFAVDTDHLSVEKSSSPQEKSSAASRCQMARCATK